MIYKKTLKFLLISTCIITAWCSFFKDNKPTTIKTEPINIPIEIKTPETKTEAQRTYNYLNKEKWFSLQVPSDWTFQETVFNSIVVLFAPQLSWDTIKENLWITSLEISWAIDLNTYYKQKKSFLENIINDFELISKEEVNIKNIKWITISYKGTDEWQKLRRQQTFFFISKTVYIFTYTTTQETYQDFLQDVNSIINSFSI